MKNKFNGYAKDDRRLFAYPFVSFIFGIRDIDDGYIFDMNDRGHLHLKPIHLERQQTLIFFKEFISNLANRRDLFGSNYDLYSDFETFYQVRYLMIDMTSIYSGNHEKNTYLVNFG
jgi:hypothetical protein